MGKIIGLMGEARSGKDTVANFLVEKYGFKKLAWADTLKAGCAEIFGFSWDQCYGDLKEVVDPYWGKTPREILQFVGTDLFRDGFQEDFWVRASMRKIIDSPELNWVISDCRFKNEFQAIKEINGGEMWKLVRLDGPGASGGISGHKSEEELKSIPDADFDQIIECETGVGVLLATVEKVLEYK